MNSWLRLQRELKKTLKSWLKLQRSKEDGELMVETTERTEETDVDIMVETKEKSRKWLNYGCRKLRSEIEKTVETTERNQERGWITVETTK